jgi:hypothetical protein
MRRRSDAPAAGTPLAGSRDAGMPLDFNRHPSVASYNPERSLAAALVGGPMLWRKRIQKRRSR